MIQYLGHYSWPYTAAIGIFSFLGGGGRGEGGEAGFIGPVEATPSMGGALTCCLGVGAFLDCFGGVISSLRSSCLDRFEDSTLVSVLICLGT